MVLSSNCRSHQDLGYFPSLMTRRQSAEFHQSLSWWLHNNYLLVDCTRILSWGPAKSTTVPTVNYYKQLLLFQRILWECWYLSLLTNARLSRGISRDLWEAEHGAMSQGTCYAESSYRGRTPVCTPVPAHMHMWKSEDKLLESVISFHQVVAGDRTQVFRLVCKHTLLTESLCRLTMQILDGWFRDSESQASTHIS